MRLGGGPRESPERGFTNYREAGEGRRDRSRGELFADHYSQACQFFVSQTATEQAHIKNALVFELSKVETPAIRAGILSHLLNIDQELAQGVAAGLGLADMPRAAEPARPVLRDLPPSPALSILKNGPRRFEGRKLGVLLTDGASSSLLKALQSSVESKRGIVELVAPTVGGVAMDDGSAVPAKQKINGGPSVLYDAVAILASRQGTELLVNEATARDFVADAFAHAKFIAYSEEVLPLLPKAGIAPDRGCVVVRSADEVAQFLEACGELRFWDREPTVQQV